MSKLWPLCCADCNRELLTRSLDLVDRFVRVTWRDGSGSYSYRQLCLSCWVLVPRTSSLVRDLVEAIYFDPVTIKTL